MTTLTLKNVPEALHRRLKELAEHNHRSLNKEIIARLERQLMQPHQSTEEKLAEIRALRQRIPLYIVPEEVFALKSQGRP